MHISHLFNCLSNMNASIPRNGAGLGKPRQVTSDWRINLLAHNHCQTTSQTEITAGSPANHVETKYNIKWIL